MLGMNHIHCIHVAVVHISWRNVMLAWTVGRLEHWIAPSGAMTYNNTSIILGILTSLWWQINERDKEKELWPNIARSHSFLPKLFAISAIKHAHLGFAFSAISRFTNDLPIYWKASLFILRDYWQRHTSHWHSSRLNILPGRSLFLVGLKKKNHMTSATSYS